MTQEEIITLANEISKHLAIYSKKVLTFDDAVELTGFKKSYLYQLTSRKEIPYYKPNGNKMYFDREELEAWMLAHRVATQEELASKAQQFCISSVI